MSRNNRTINQRGPPPPPPMTIRDGMVIKKEGSRLPRLRFSREQRRYDPSPSLPVQQEEEKKEREEKKQEPLPPRPVKTEPQKPPSPKPDDDDDDDALEHKYDDRDDDEYTAADGGLSVRDFPIPPDYDSNLETIDYICRYNPMGVWMFIWNRFIRQLENHSGLTYQYNMGLFCLGKYHGYCSLMYQNPELIFASVERTCLLWDLFYDMGIYVMLAWQNLSFNLDGPADRYGAVDLYYILLDYEKMNKLAILASLYYRESRWMLAKKDADRPQFQETADEIIEFFHQHPTHGSLDNDEKVTIDPLVREVAQQFSQDQSFCHSYRVSLGQPFSWDEKCIELETSNQHLQRFLHHRKRLVLIWVCQLTFASPRPRGQDPNRFGKPPPLWPLWAEVAVLQPDPILLQPYQLYREKYQKDHYTSYIPFKVMNAYCQIVEVLYQRAHQSIQQPPIPSAVFERFLIAESSIATLVFLAKCISHQVWYNQNAMGGTARTTKHKQPRYKYWQYRCNLVLEEWIDQFILSDFIVAHNHQGS